jgi:hypothetical protein
VLKVGPVAKKQKTRPRKAKGCWGGVRRGAGAAFEATRNKDQKTINNQEGARRIKAGTISRKTSDSTDKPNGQNSLDIAIANALELLRGQNYEN